LNNLRYFRDIKIYTWQDTYHWLATLNWATGSQLHGLGPWSAAVILAARLMIILGINWSAQPPQLSSPSHLAETLFYGLVGHGRAAVPRADLPTFQRMERVRYDLGFGFGFLLWHIFGQGPVVGLATFVIGLLFALIRWRAGGILGLIILHGLWDLETFAGG
jgi:hypothetical protein